MAKYSSPASENTTTEMQIWSVLKKANAPHVLELLDNFQEEGPNGTHTCLVYELMGGPVTSRAEYLANMQRLHTFVPHYEPYPKTLAKRILKQTLLGLDAIHRCDIVHGDIQPGNLLFTARGLDEVDESQLQHDPAKITTPLKRRDGKKDYWAPEYLAINHPLFEYAGFGPDAEIRISDFGAGKITISHVKYKIKNSTNTTQHSSPKAPQPKSRHQSLSEPRKLFSTSPSMKRLISGASAVSYSSSLQALNYSRSLGCGMIHKKILMMTIC